MVTHHMLGADLALAVPIYSGGRLSGNVAAKLAEDAARHASHWTRVDLVFRVTATYYSILAQRRLISALDAAEEATAKSIERLRALVAARKATPLDRQRMEVRLAALKQRRVEDEAALEVQTLTLLSLVGLSGERAATEVGGELGMPSLTLPASPEALVEHSPSSPPRSPAGSAPAPTTPAPPTLRRAASWRSNASPMGQSSGRTVTCWPRTASSARPTTGACTFAGSARRVTGTSSRSWPASQRVSFAC